MTHLAHPFEDPRLPDLYDSFPFEDDIPLYRGLLAEVGHRVLEVACGTGRLLLPLAASGASVVGVDASPAMLARARSKLASCADDVSGRVRLLAADMRDFDAGAAFDLAVVAVKSFGYMATRSDQQQALVNIAAHLRPGSMVVLDLLNPSLDWLAAADGTVTQDLCRQRPDGATVMRTETTVATDRVSQVRLMRSAYETISPDGAVSKAVVEWPLRYAFRNEAELLLESAGIEVVAEWGDYDRSPYGPDSRALIVAGRR